LVIHTLGSVETELPRPEANNSVEEVPLGCECPERAVQLGREMEAPVRHSLIELLQEYQNVFAFDPVEMLGIDPSIMEHKLKVDPAYKPVTQKKRHMGLKRATAATVEV